MKKITVLDENVLKCIVGKKRFFYENWIKKQKLNLLFLKIIDCYIKE